jgi:flagellar biosynthesis protein FliQ
VRAATEHVHPPDVRYGRETYMSDLWDQFLEELETIGQTIGEWLPKIIVALIVLIVGRWLLGWIRRLTVKLLETRPSQAVFESSGVNRALGASDSSPAQLTGMIVYGVLMIGLLLIVFRVLEIPDIVDLLERLLAWVPNVILAAIVVIISASVANWTANLVAPFAAARHVGWLTIVVRVSVVVFGVLIAMDIVEITFAADLVKIVVAATGVAIAIAFGVGGIDTAKEWWRRYASPGAMSSGTSGTAGTPAQSPDTSTNPPA